MRRIHIDKEELIQLIEKELSTRQIAKELNCSQMIEVQKCDLLYANCHLELHHPFLST